MPSILPPHDPAVSTHTDGVTQALEQLTALLYDGPGAPDTMETRVLTLLAESLNVDVAALCAAEGTVLHIVSAYNRADTGWCAGTAIPLAHTYDGILLRGRAHALLIEDAAHDPHVAALPMRERQGMAAYSGVALYHADGQLYGTLCVMNQQARRSPAGEAALLAVAGHLLVSRRDATARQQPAEEGEGDRTTMAPSTADLVASERHYRRIFEAGQDGILLLDPQTGRITGANPYLLDLLGCTREDILSKRLWDLGPEHDRTASQEAFKALQDHGYVRYGNLPLQTKDGRQISVEVVCSVYRVGSRDEVQCRIRDMTTHMLAEEESRNATAKLTRSNRDLEAFASVASHDLQEPLRKIRAFGDRLKGKYAGLLDNDGRDYLDRMLAASERMQVLINDLLAYSRVATKGQPFVPIDLAAIVHDVLSDIEMQIERVGGRVEVGDLPCIEADPLQMRQLLQNLISNALKFHDPGRPPIVRVTGRIQQTAEMGDAAERDHAGVALSARLGVCQITVADNGIGFDEKYLDTIFSVFRRLHGRDEYEGTGIGLAICQRIVERHGGHITAHSTPGEGATFVVMLPVAQPKGDTTE